MEVLSPGNAGACTPLFPDLEGQSVFITGGGSGIGAALTRAFAAQGARVGFVSLREEPANRLCDEVEQCALYRPAFVRCDVRDIQALGQAIAKFRIANGPIGVLINNAARDNRHRLDSMTVEEWDDSISTNLRPYFFTTQFVQKDMTSLGYGSVINLGSNCAILGLTGISRVRCRKGRDRRNDEGARTRIGPRQGPRKCTGAGVGADIEAKGTVGYGRSTGGMP